MTQFKKVGTANVSSCYCDTLLCLVLYAGTPMDVSGTCHMICHMTCFFSFKNDGQGSVFCETTSEGKETIFLCCNNLVFSVLDVLAQLIMTWMLLFISLGWTLGSSVSHPLHDKKLLILIISVGVVEVSLHI